MKIKEFYEGKTLLVTGCTGFLGMYTFILIWDAGKVVLEKILRSLTVKKVFILIRPKVS